MIDKYQALAEYLRQRADRPFEWGVNDCCIFAADWVLAATGRDPMGGMRNTYDNESWAANTLETGGGLARLVSSKLSIALPTVATAQRGDIILFETEKGPALGICVGEKFAAVPPAGGVAYFSMRHAVTAWRVA